MTTNDVINIRISDERARLIHILVVHFDMFRDKAEEAADLFLHDKILASRHPQPVNEPGEPDQWRDLALQFDGHRIECLSMLRYAVRWIEEYATVRDILREPLASLKTFLAAPPLPGEAVLAARIEALRAASIPAQERSKEETAYAAISKVVFDCRERQKCTGESDQMLSRWIAEALSALHKEGEAQCCVCGKKGLSIVEGDGGTECQLEDGRWTCSQDCYFTAVDWFSRSAAPVPVKITPEMVERLARHQARRYRPLFPDETPEVIGEWVESHWRTLEAEAREALAAALSQKPGEQG